MAPVNRSLALSGAGALDATLALTRVQAGLALSGAGALVAGPGAVTTRVQRRGLALAGAGSLTAPNTAPTTLQQRRGLALAGAGSLTAGGGASRTVQSRGLALAGAGSLTAGAAAAGWKGVEQMASGLPTATLHTFRAKVRSQNGATVRLQLEDSAAGVTTTEQAVGPDWTTLSVSRSTGAGTTLRARFLVAPGQVADIDEAMLRPGAGGEAFRMHASDPGEVYAYTISRNLDGSGANDWAEGDALFNTGQVGSGFIDLYSVQGLTSLPLTAIFNYQAAGAKYGPNHALDTAWEWFGDDAFGAVNDAIYFGLSGATFDALHFRFSQAWSLAGGSFLWEYWTGGSWATLSPGSTGGFTTGISYTWTPPVGWAATTVNGVSAYWVRFRATSGASFMQKARTSARASRGRRSWGPTIVGNVRTGTAYNAWSEHWALGNLSGLYDYGADTYGVAIGKFSPTTAWASVDPTNGLRIMYGTTQKAKYSDTILLGEAAAGKWNTYITDSAWFIRLATQDIVGVTPVQAYIRDPANLTSFMRMNANQMDVVRNGATVARFGADVLLYDQSTSDTFAQLTSGELLFARSGLVKIRIGAQGGFYMGTNCYDWASIKITLVGTTGIYGESGETLSAGSVMLGRNAAGAGNMLWDAADNRIRFRGGWVTQAYIDTDGSFMAGQGAVKINQDGMELAPTTGFIFSSNSRGSIKWRSTKYPTQFAMFIHGWEGYFGSIKTSNTMEIFARGYTENSALSGGSIILTGESGSSAGNSASVSILGGTSGSTASTVNLFATGSIALLAPLIRTTGSIRTTASGSDDYYSAFGGGIPSAKRGLYMLYDHVQDRAEMGTLHAGVAWKNFILMADGFGFRCTPNTLHRVRITTPADDSSAYALVITSANESANRLLVRGDSFFGISAASWTNISDERIKADVSPLDAERWGDGFDVVAALMGTEFVAHRYTDREDPGRHFGVLAQRERARWPMLVHQFDETGLLGFNYTELIPPLGVIAQRHERALAVLGEALQEGRAERDALRGELAALRALVESFLSGNAYHGT